MTWTTIVVQRYIQDEVQESLVLEYKAAEALSKADAKKAEITKDVSAMANSAGGIIIYGVAEYNDPKKRHLPERIDPIDQSTFSKEWLEQIINSIRPRITGIIIHPIRVDNVPNSVVYIVDIPQSNTAHQAIDMRYYRRFNFQSVPLADYEIRDIMGRLQLPSLEISFVIRKAVVTVFKKNELVVSAKNISNVYGHFVKVDLFLPPILTSHEVSLLNREIKLIDNIRYFVLSLTNTRRDILEEDDKGNEKHGPSWFEPIFPASERTWTYKLPNPLPKFINDEEIIWEVYADNAPKRLGRVKASEIALVKEYAPVSKVMKKLWSDSKNRPLVIVMFLSFALAITSIFLDWSNIKNIILLLLGS